MFMRFPKYDFTIITPVFNGERYLRETINSVLENAPTGRYQYIVIDDGSSDRTSLIADDFRDRIEIIRQNNAGEAAAVNVGLTRALGRFTLVVSADDPLISPDLFNQSLNVFNNNPSVVVVYPDWQIIDELGEPIKKVITQEFSLRTLLGLNVCIPGPGAIFRTSTALQIGGRNTKLKYGSDYDFWLRISSLGQFVRLPEVLAQWRKHADSTSIKFRGLEMAKERISLIENILNQDKLPKRLVRQARGNAYYNAAILRYFSKDVPHRKFLLKAFRSRLGWVESAKVHEVVYLLGIPITEYIWLKIKSLKKPI